MTGNYGNSWDTKKAHALFVTLGPFIQNAAGINYFVVKRYSSFNCYLSDV